MATMLTLILDLFIVSLYYRNTRFRKTALIMSSGKTNYEIYSAGSTVWSKTR